MSEEEATIVSAEEFARISDELDREPKILPGLLSLAAKDARIAELEAQVARVWEMLEGSADGELWMAWMIRAALEGDSDD